MELLNITKMRAGVTMGMQPDGRELLVVVVKGTFAMPANEKERAALANTQVPLITADVFTGEAGLSSVRYESDHAPVKRRCDVILNGSAYAPAGRPATKVTVLMRIGPISKSFNVVGDRVWSYGLTSVSPTDPKPFVRMPISYDVAFGGADTSDKDPAHQRAYMENPVGEGFHHNVKLEYVERRPLPNTEEIHNPVSSPGGNYRPMSFGCVGRNFTSRVQFAGTYDKHWLDTTFPFLPSDFSEAYYQSAPADQQMPYPQGGEAVTLINLTPQGHTQFRLPSIPVAVQFNLKNGKRHATAGVIDTVLIEPDEKRFMMIWRAALPLKRNMFEVAQVVVGDTPKARNRARETSTTGWYSLRELVKHRQRGEAKA